MLNGAFNTVNIEVKLEGLSAKFDEFGEGSFKLYPRYFIFCQLHSCNTGPCVVREGGGDIVTCSVTAPSRVGNSVEVKTH